MSRRARWEVLTAVYQRYRGAARVERGRIRNEFCETTGYQRKYALRLLNGPPPGLELPRRRRVVQVDVRQPPRSGDQVAVLEGVRKVYGRRVVPHGGPAARTRWRRAGTRRARFTSS